MENLNIIVSVLVVLFISITITGIFMKFANDVGERIGIYKILRDLWKQISKRK